MPLNKNVTKNFEKYYISETEFKCKELDNNEILRIFNYFDKGKKEIKFKMQLDLSRKVT
jgi:hypothetical protein